MPTLDFPPWDDLPAILLQLTPEGEALVLNRGFAEFAQMPAEAALGTGWWALLPPEARDALMLQLARRRDFQIPLRLRAAQGAPAWFDCAARWLPQPGHYLCVLHDVSAGKAAELAAQAQAAQFRLLADSLPALIAYYELEGFRCRFANRQYARTFGFDERSIVGRSFAEIIGPEGGREVAPHVERLLRERQPVLYERTLQGPDGRPRWLEVTMVPQLDADGAVFAAFVLVADITKHRLAEASVRESQVRMAKFMQASCEGIVFHRDGQITDANPALCELVGWSLEELRGRAPTDFVAPDQVARAAAAVASGQDLGYESAIVRRDGTRVPVEFIGRTILHDGEPVRLSIVRDLRERLAAQARIHHLAHHDVLTGLPNRAAFIERLEHLTASTRSGDASLALLFIDLDHFKRVNDSLGHLAGDRLLQTVAVRISACLRASDLVARFGGDEFLVLLAGVAARQDVEDIARKLLAAIEAPVDLDGWSISVSPSIGIARHPHDGDTPTALIKNADAAMYQAKASGRANFQFFDPGVASAAYSALVLEGELAQAIERGEFRLLYQPQVHARSGALVGTEALIRWEHPERGTLLPDAFIPVAEQRRLMLAIGRWALAEAARAAQRWQATVLAGVPVAVNLSTMQFDAPDFLDTVAQVLAETGLPGHLLQLELTERMLMADLASVKARLLRLEALGIRVAIDDFGTGYASLGHLKELPIDKIKIDRGFVQDLPTGRDSAAIARAIVQMGQSLDIAVVAEGVETAAQQQFLAHCGCDELQGHLIGLPMAPAALEAWSAARAVSRRVSSPAAASRPAIADAPVKP